METAPTSQFKTLQILHAALCVGPAIFLGLAFFVNTNQLVWFPNAEKGSTINFIGIGFAIFGVLLSTLLYRSLLSKIDTSLPLSKKFPKYTSAFIVRCALLEGAALFNTAVFMVTGCLINAIISALLMVLLISLRPERQKLVDDLKIQYPDILE